MKKANRRDVLTILFLCLAVACLMTACMNSTGDNQNATASPSAMTSPSPAPSPAASATPAAFDWMTKSAEVEERIARISEIGEARVITSGNTALVAVKFAPAYQGDMTARIREMIAGEVMQADPEIKTVAVTSEDDDVTTVYQLSDRIRAGETIDTLKTDIDEIVRNTTTLT